MKQIQCKDISDHLILEFLAKNPRQQHNWFPIDESISLSKFSVRHVIPNIPDKLLVAKMASMIKKGLVDGCGCGCRGDYVITEKGLSYLNELATSS